MISAKVRSHAALHAAQLVRELSPLPFQKKTVNALCRLQSATGVVVAHEALDGQQLADEVSTAPHCKQHSAA